jgi:hypothetical protein
MCDPRVLRSDNIPDPNLLGCEKILDPC